MKCYYCGKHNCKVLKHGSGLIDRPDEALPALDLERKLETNSRYEKIDLNEAFGTDFNFPPPAQVGFSSRGKKKETTFLGIEGMVPAQSVRTLSAAPQRHFKAERFFINASIAPYFRIRSIRIGMSSQMLDQSPLPASMFALRQCKETGEQITPGADVEWPVILVGQLFQLDVENISNMYAEQLFSAGLQGWVASF